MDAHGSATTTADIGVAPTHLTGLATILLTGCATTVLTIVPSGVATTALGVIGKMDGVTTTDRSFQLRPTARGVLIERVATPRSTPQPEMGASQTGAIAPSRLDAGSTSITIPAVPAQPPQPASPRPADRAGTSSSDKATSSGCIPREPYRKPGLLEIAGVRFLSGGTKNVSRSLFPCGL
jgi:hypothetical protein